MFIFPNNYVSEFLLFRIIIWHNLLFHLISSSQNFHVTEKLFNLKHTGRKIMATNSNTANRKF